MEEQKKEPQLEPDLIGEEGLPQPPVETEPGPVHPPVEPSLPPVIPHYRRRGRKILGWMILILGLFALGLGLEYFLYVRPLTRELKTARADLAVLNETRDKLAAAELNLLDKQAELDVTSTSLKDAQLHVALLQVQNDIAVTRLAITGQSWETATTALDLAQKDLNTVGSLMPGTDSIIALQTRLKTATEAFKEKRYTVTQSELESLVGDLNLLVQRLVK